MERKTQLRHRIQILFTLFLLGLGILLIRSAALQLTPSEKIRSLSERQYQTTVVLAGQRGAILDRKGKELAVSETAYSLFVDPSAVENRKLVARRLARELSRESGATQDLLFEKISDPKKKFVWIARQLSKVQRDRIKAFNLRGVGFIEESKRIYPNDEILGATLGFVGKEGQGLEGLELEHNELLTRDRRTLLMRRDARGRPLVVDGQLFVEGEQGSDLTSICNTSWRVNFEKCRSLLMPTKLLELCWMQGPRPYWLCPHGPELTQIKRQLLQVS